MVGGVICNERPKVEGGGGGASHRGATNIISPFMLGLLLVGRS